MFTIQTTTRFDAWFNKLQDRVAVSRIRARIAKAEMGHLGDWQAVGEGVSEMRIDHGPGYRIYFTRRGKNLVILLAGGDKSSKSAQSKDIKLAQLLAQNI